MLAAQRRFVTINFAAHTHARRDHRWSRAVLAVSAAKDILRSHHGGGMGKPWYKKPSTFAWDDPTNWQCKSCSYWHISAHVACFWCEKKSKAKPVQSPPPKATMQKPAASVPAPAAWPQPRGVWADAVDDDPCWDDDVQPAADAPSGDSSSFALSLEARAVLLAGLGNNMPSLVAKAKCIVEKHDAPEPTKPQPVATEATLLHATSKVNRLVTACEKAEKAYNEQLDWIETLCQRHKEAEERLEAAQQRVKDIREDLCMPMASPAAPVHDAMVDKIQQILRDFSLKSSDSEQLIAKVLAAVSDPSSTPPTPRHDADMDADEFDHYKPSDAANAAREANAFPPADSQPSQVPSAHAKSAGKSSGRSEPYKCG